MSFAPRSVQGEVQPVPVIVQYDLPSYSLAESKGRRGE
jgi:hypothetical protein